MGKLAAASRGLGSRFLFPQMALRSYFPVEVGFGALLAGEETTELGGMGAGLEELGKVAMVLEGEVVSTVGGLLSGVAG